MTFVTLNIDLKKQKWKSGKITIKRTSMPIAKTKKRTSKHNKVYKTYAKEWAESGSPHQGWGGGVLISVAQILKQLMKSFSSLI